MKRVALLMAVAVLGFTASLRAGNELGKPDATTSAPRNAKHKAIPKSPDAAYVESMDNAVHLSDAQKTAMFGIFDGFYKDVDTWKAQNAAKIQAASKALNEALKGKDKEAIRRANDEYIRVYGPMYKRIRQFETDLEDVTTPDQKAKLQDWMARARIKGITDPIQLSEEQVKLVLAAVGGVRNKLNEDVVLKVLTQDQKAAIAKYRTMSAVKLAMIRQGALTDQQWKRVEARNLAIITRPQEQFLTDQQWKQVEARCEVLVKDIKNPFETGEIVDKLRDMANALLTPEQREAIKAKAKSGNPFQPQPGGTPQGGGMSGPRPPQ